MMANSNLTARVFTDGQFEWQSDYPLNCRKYYSKHHQQWLTCLDAFVCLFQNNND